VRRIEVDDATLPDRPDLGDPLEPGDPLPPALHTWSRLEPLPQSSDLAPALQATVADPLWLLARQWQFLEFAGEDAGTPIEVRIEGEAAMVSRYLPGALGEDAAARARDYGADGVPLEVAVEAERTRAAHPRLAAEAGLHLRRMLEAAGLTGLPAHFVAAYPLELGEAAAGDTGADWLALARGRALDARTLAAALLPLRGVDGTLSALPPRPAIPAPSRAAARGVLERWLAWSEAEIVEPASGAAAWDPRRLEYAFAAAARTSAGEVVLAADEYTGGTLDWQSVSAALESLGEPAAPQPPQAVALRPTLPVPVGYAGKPADRFWEFEDAAVHFGAIDAGPTDLARLLLVEFALVYGNDWFVVPARLPVGSLFRARSFEVRDTFGVVTQVERSQDAGGTWSLFEVDGADGFFLAPTLADALGGNPVEQVALFRDEMANMAWGVERRVQGASGDGYDRADEASRLAAQQQVDGPPVDAQLVYRLATAVPEQWIPFVPVAAAASTAANPVVELQRRAVLHVEVDGERRRIEPRGVLLGGGGDLRLAEEEVPREGAVVERSFQFARWFDGRSLLWLGRRKHAGRGEGASGLRFDAAVAPEASPPLDAAPPPPPTIKTPVDSSYHPSGAVAVGGTAEAGSTVQLYEGTTAKGRAKAAGDGRFSIALSGAPEGRHTYTVKATDAAGNTSAASAPLTVTFDWTAPPPPTITAPPNNSQDPDGALTFRGRAEPLSTVHLYEGATVIGAVKTGADGTWSIAVSRVAQGRHTYAATATDLAGNASTRSPGHTIIVGKPRVTVTAVSPAVNATGVSPTANVTATFSERMRPASINTNTITLVRKGTTTKVPGSVRYDATTRRAILDPTKALRRAATYIVTVGTGARDLAGKPLAATKSWSFTVRR